VSDDLRGPDGEGPGSPWLTAGLLATGFLSAAAILIVEIIAGRILAPYVGMSVYTWTAIISTVLAGLAIGNWLGGYCTTGGDTACGKRLGTVLVGAALVTALVPLLAKPVAGFVLTRTESAVVAVTALSCGLFFVPALLGGMPAPILAKMIVTGNRHREGKVLGWTFAAGSAGAIGGSAISGFVLIPYLGSANSALLAAGLLGVLGALWFLSAGALRRALLAMPAVLGVAGLSAAAWETVCQRETATFCINVVGLDAPTWQESRVRGLVLDHLMHGVNVEHVEDALLSPYVAQIDRAARVLRPGARSAFFIGGGAYTLPRAWYRSLDVTVAEIEPAVTAVAAEHLWLDSDQIKVDHRDARMSLTADPKARFDLIVGDAFKDVAAPFHLTTQEFFQLTKRRLAPGGLFFLNLVDKDPEPSALLAVVATLRTVFPQVHVWRDGALGEQGRRTYVVSAGTTDFPEQTLRRAAQDGWRLYRPSDNALAAAPVLTDDHAPLEHLLGLLTDTID